MNAVQDITQENGTATDRSQLELEHLSRQIKKLELEIDQLRSVSRLDRYLSRYLPAVAALLAVSGFWFSVFEFYSRQQIAQAEREDALRREAAKPFWDTQLKLYFDASEAAAVIATSDKEADRRNAIDEFWKLYWGPLACVEDIGFSKAAEASPNSRHALVEMAMVTFGDHLKTSPPAQDPKLKQLSLELAHAIRSVIGPAFQLPTPELVNARKN